MIRNVAKILPNMAASDVNSLVLQWEYAYADKANSVFKEEETGAFPFSHLISTSLASIAKSMNVALTRSQFSDLVQSWGALTPWKGTQETLEILANANITLGTISNGDRYTLQSAMSVFKPPVSIKHIFVSDFPIGAFKPQPEMYYQALTVGFKADEVIHVAGGSTDASGARDGGLFSAYLQAHVNPFEAKRKLSGSNATQSNTAPCFVLNDISELPAILGLKYGE